MKTSEHLQVGEIYTRKQLKEMFQITDNTLDNGIFAPAGHDSIWLLLTEENPEFKNTYEQGILEFSGQPLGRTNKRIIYHKQNGLEVLLFFRQSNKQYANSGFLYCGLVEYISHEGEKPARFLLESVEHGRPITVARQAIEAYNAEESLEPRTEGGVTKRLVNVYERDSHLRARAIEIHKLNCHICGFNFGETYGEIGEGYIEVHHIIPISTFGEARTVKPETDMMTVCANCHRMLHRSVDNPISLEKLREIIEKRRATP